MIGIDDTVDQVRKELDEVTLSGDLAVYAQEFEDLFSSEFGDEDLRDRVLDGARYLAARVRARYQTDNVRRIDSDTTGEIDFANNRILDDPVADGVTPMIRLLAASVQFEDQNGEWEAQRRTMLGNEKIEDTGRAATANEPAFVYQDYEFVFEKGSGSGRATADVVELIQPTNASFDGVSWTYNDGGTSRVPLPEILQEALIQYVIYSCFLTLQEPEMAEFSRNRMISELSPYALPGAFGQQQESENNESS